MRLVLVCYIVSDQTFCYMELLRFLTRHLLYCDDLLVLWSDSHFMWTLLLCIWILLDTHLMWYFCWLNLILYLIAICCFGETHLLVLLRYLFYTVIPLKFALPLIQLFSCFGGKSRCLFNFAIFADWVNPIKLKGRETTFRLNCEILTRI